MKLIHSNSRLAQKLVCKSTQLPTSRCSSRFQNNNIEWHLRLSRSAHLRICVFRKCKNRLTWVKKDSGPIEDRTSKAKWAAASQRSRSINWNSSAKRMFDPGCLSVVGKIQTMKFLRRKNRTVGNLFKVFETNAKTSETFEFQRRQKRKSIGRRTKARSSSSKAFYRSTQAVFIPKTRTATRHCIKPPTTTTSTSRKSS